MALEITATMRVIRHNLMSDPDVYRIVGSSVFTAHTRDAEEATRLQPTVIIELRSGDVRISAPVARRTAWIYAYSNRSPDEARELYDAIAKVLRRRGLRGQLDAMGNPCDDMCLYAWEQNAVIEAYNDLASAWFTRGTFSIHTQG